MVQTALMEGRNTMGEVEKFLRRVKISKQRQINIPKDYYEALDLKDEAIVEFTGRSIIIRPVEVEVVDFSTDILKDLVAQGYEGEELIQKFSQIKSEIPKALDRVKQELLKRPGFTGSLDEYLEQYPDLEEDEKGV